MWNRFSTAEAVDVAMWQRRVLTDLKSAGIVQDHQLWRTILSFSILPMHITKQSIAETSRLMAELNAHDVYPSADTVAGNIARLKITLSKHARWSKQLKDTLSG